MPEYSFLPLFITIFFGFDMLKLVCGLQTPQLADFNKAILPDISSIEFTVEGEPCSLMRHRVSHGRMYNPSSSAQKAFLKNCSSSLPSTPWDGPVAMTVRFYFSRPKSHFRTGKFAHLLRSDAPNWHTNRNGIMQSICPVEFNLLDIDNLVKFVMDALNEKAFIDDRQVVALSACKLYANDTPKTEIRLERVKVDKNESLAEG